MHRINFKAHYVTNINVLKRKPQGKYQPEIISVVSIDKNNTQDLSALDEVCNNWVGNIFCDDIKDAAKYSLNDKNRKVWAATSQKEGFEKLNPNKILCLINMNLHPNKTEIFHIESVPIYVNNKYDHAGTYIIEYIKTKTKLIELFCPSAKVIKEFYSKLGFEQKAPDSKKIINFGELYWLKNPKSLEGILYRLYNKIIYSFKK